MIRVPPAEMVQALQIWLTIIAQRQPSLLRDLWTRKGDEYDGTKIDRAKRELARVLAQRFETAKWEVMREEGEQEGWYEQDERQLPLPRF